MPELFSSMPSSPQIHVQYLAPGHKLITPEQFHTSNPESIGGNLAKMSPTVAVKWGHHASLIEAKNMLYVAEKTSIPVPKLYAAYAYGPIDRDLNDHATVYDVYIFMEFIEGEDLGKAWDKHTSTEKQAISADLKKHMDELRSLPPANYIGSVDEGPVTDNMLEWSTSCRGISSRPYQAFGSVFLTRRAGPFKSIEDFNATIIDAFVTKSKTQIGPYARGMLNAHKHGIVFTHGDLRPDNVIVKDGRVAAIIDWEMSGWYPEYWEFAKAFYIEWFVNDWGSHLLGVLEPYYCEQLMHARLMEVLW
ncbi:hypothetical protein J4E85_006331 [Alternaria conjuncta]|uniref:uncharacterized protein n=1 Tax=Alternaria conjuncta TaxID=181017 RepID=UPI00221EBCDB|nr:uncharacterized protein J4E85_006331 [Alternaria conjuncta]KAI4927819.1 hypothetical protein J4E85_006331 [Alternaria conjuncta]